MAKRVRTILGILVLLVSLGWLYNWAVLTHHPVANQEKVAAVVIFSKESPAGDNLDFANAKQPINYSAICNPPQPLPVGAHITIWVRPDASSLAEVGNAACQPWAPENKIGSPSNLLPPVINCIIGILALALLVYYLQGWVESRKQAKGRRAGQIRHQREVASQDWLRS